MQIALNKHFKHDTNTYDMQPKRTKQTQQKADLRGAGDLHGGFVVLIRPGANMCKTQTQKSDVFKKIKTSFIMDNFEIILLFKHQIISFQTIIYSIS